jgi:iron complex outermembrane receptor protein
MNLTPHRITALKLALAAAFPLASADTLAQQTANDAVPVLLATHTLERVTVTGNRPSTLPTEIPTTLESITGETIAKTINAADAEDALKYFPSLNVRKRYIGDYDHAVLATRASGTGNSARSLVYADGILLSNLLGNGASYTPRWGLVTPEEIERVDVLYGPFSAAYSGNSAGAIVDFVTRMPTQFEAHAKLQGFTQNFKVYGSDDRFSGGSGSASLGNKNGDWAWWVNLNRLDSTGQPIAFATRLVSQGVAGSAGTPVSGAVAGQNPSGKDWLVFGDTNRIHTVQDHAKLKLAYDISATLRASYTLGAWTNTADREVSSYLRDAAGNTVYGSAANAKVNIDGRDYTLVGSDFAPSHGKLEHLAQGLSLKSNTRGTWDWEAAASVYDYTKDEVRTPLPTAFLPAAALGGAGRIADMKGTGWNTLALKGIWRPQGYQGEHTVEGGLQRDAFKLRTLVSNTSDWLGGDAGTRFSSFNGNTTLASAWAQDAWRFSPHWKAVIGGRLEHWRAFNGEIADATTAPPQAFAERSESHFSPKAALSFSPGDDWTFKASVGRAVRMPTVAELYQGSISAGTIVNNDPTLKPEKSWTGELTAERYVTGGVLRATLFHERTTDALYSQANVAAGSTVTTIQNVDAMRTTGLELAAQVSDVGIKGLDLGASLTYADSLITKNDKFPASVGQWQPRVPKWRANLLATWQPDDRWSFSGGVRYSGRQYGTLDNSDPNGEAYTGVSSFLVADLRVQYRIDKQWKASAGIDNLGNRTYWAFHPYTQRTFNAELRYDY